MKTKRKKRRKKKKEKKKTKEKGKEKRKKRETQKEKKEKENDRKKSTAVQLYSYRYRYRLFGPEFIKDFGPPPPSLPACGQNSLRILAVQGFLGRLPAARIHQGFWAASRRPEYFRFLFQHL